MKLDAVIPCLEVRTRDDGLTDILGAWSFWHFPAYPASWSAPLAVRVSGEPGETAWLTLELLSPADLTLPFADGPREGPQVLLRAEAMVTIPAGDRTWYFPLAFEGVTIPAPGDYTVTVTIGDGMRVLTVPFLQR